MTTGDFVARVLHGGDKGVGATLLRGALTPLSWLHRAGLAAYLLPFRVGVRRRFRLGIPTIAIGNLSSGGTGKTPFAALVAARLSGAGQRVVLLSRGHRSRSNNGHAPRVVSDGVRTLLGPAEAGDEPALLARLLPGVPVMIGRDRRRSGRVARERFAPDVVVLDDALQFWQLHRDLDIVLLDARRPFDNGHVLPRGLLREPPSHLKRAGIIVLTRADRVSPGDLAAAKQQVVRLAPCAAVFAATHAPLGWMRLGEQALLPLDTLQDRDVAAFSGIADCGSFVHSVEALGARIVHLRDFGDHHAYVSDDLAVLLREAGPACDAFVTTEKDLVKLESLWPRENAPPLYALRIGIKIDDAPRFWRLVEQALLPR